VLEYDQKTGKWDKYDDPDGENELVLFKDQGLIHEIVTSVSYVDNVLWAATYFGDSHYNGRYWHNFLTKDSGLPSNFTNVVKGVDGTRAWFGTDKGLAYYDGVTARMVFDPNGKNTAPLYLGTVHNGAITYRIATMEKPPAVGQTPLARQKAGSGSCCRWKAIRIGVLLLPRLFMRLWMSMRWRFWCWTGTQATWQSNLR
jgi:hypothetical protein